MMPELHRPDQHGRDLPQLVLRRGPREDAHLPEPGLAERVQLRQPLISPGHRQPRVLVLAPPQHPQLVVQLAHLGIDQPLVTRIGHHEPPERPFHQRDERRLEQSGPTLDATPAVPAARDTASTSSARPAATTRPRWAPHAPRSGTATHASRPRPPASRWAPR